MLVYTTYPPSCSLQNSIFLHGEKERKSVTLEEDLREDRRSELVDTASLSLSLFDTVAWPTCNVLLQYKSIYPPNERTNHLFVSAYEKKILLPFAAFLFLSVQ